MKKCLTILSLVSSLFTLSSKAQTNSVDCQSSLNQVLASLQMNEIIGYNSFSKFKEPIKIYNFADRNIKVEASATSDRWSWIKIYFLNPNSTKSLIELNYLDCKVTSVMKTNFQQHGVIINQASANGDFCRNLNAGKQLNERNSTLFFNDGSGNILSSQLELVKAMCKSASDFLK